MKKIKSKKQSNKNRIDSSLINNAFILMLVTGCLCMAFVGITFSIKLTADEKLYSVDLEVFDGENKEYHFDASEGEFSTPLSFNGELNNIYCESGYVEYDMFTEVVKIPYLNKDTKCSITFRDPAGKYLSLEGMYTVNDNDGVSYYYPGDATNNYVMFKDLLFRIVRINGDNTLRLVLDSNDLVYSFGSNNKYNDSSVKEVLKEWFNTYIGENDLVVVADYDISSYSSIEKDNLINLDSSIEDVVGMLNAKEASLVLNGEKGNYLGNTLLMNGTDGGKVFAIKDNQIVSLGTSEEYIIKPVINVKNVDMDGFGSIDNPYVLKED
jgi:hypothetical protein